MVNIVLYFCFIIFGFNSNCYILNLSLKEWKAMEIEKKYLLKKNPDFSVCEYHKIEQAYLFDENETYSIEYNKKEVVLSRLKKAGRDTKGTKYRG